MKRTSFMLVALLSVSGVCTPVSSPSALAGSATRALVRGVTPYVYAGIVGTAAVATALAHGAIKNHVWSEVNQLEKFSKSYPVPDCPVKAKITEKFAQHGYEVFFVRDLGSTTWNAAVLGSGKKVAFFVAEDYYGKTFFNDPELDTAREGIIAHEIGHVLNGDIGQRSLLWAASGPLVAAAAGCAAVATATCDYAGLIKKLSAVSSLPSLAQKAAQEIGTKAAGVLFPAGNKSQLQNVLGSTLAGCGGLLARLYAAKAIHQTVQRGGRTAMQLAASKLSRYQEKRADYSAIKLKNSKILDGMAEFFERSAERYLGYSCSNAPRKSWAQWWAEALYESHPDCCDRAGYLRKEAEKMRKQELAVHAIDGGYEKKVSAA